MKRFVRKELPLGMTVAVGTLIVAGLTGADGDAVSPIMGGFLAIAMLWERLHEAPRSDAGPKGPSGASGSRGSR